MTATDFRRDNNGTPLVTDPERTVKRTGNKAELIAQAVAAGHDLPAKITVPELVKLLGPQPASAKYARPSSYVKLIENTYNLERWNERQVVIGLAAALSRHADGPPDFFQLPRDAHLADAVAGVATMPTETDRKRFADELVAHCKDLAKAHLAAERGTHAHALTELDDEGRDWLADAERGELLGIDTDTQTRLVEAWRRLLDVNELDVLAVELPVVNDTYRAAGTLDRIVRLRKPLRFVLPTGELVALDPGMVVVLDLKTGKTPTDLGWWNGYAAQIFLYASGNPYDVTNDTRQTWSHEAPSTRWGLLAHVDVLAAIEGADDFARLMLVDLDAGRQACDIAKAARQWANVTDIFGEPYEGTGMPSAEPVPVEPSTLRQAQIERDVANRRAELRRQPPPDEGGPGDDSAFELLLQRFNELDGDRRAWVRHYCNTAEDLGVPFWPKGARTVRRFELIRGLIAFANNDANDADVRDLAAVIRPDLDGLGLPAGEMVGRFNHEDADVFARIAHGEAGLVYRDGTPYITTPTKDGPP